MGPLDFSARGPDSAKEALYSQKIVVRILRRKFDEKRAVSATQIDLERPAPAEDGEEIQRRKTIRRDELDFTWYGGGRSGGQNVRC